MTEDNSPLISDLASDPDMAELVEMFVADLHERIACLQKAISEQDLEQLKTLAHQLKGSAGGYGFTPITDASAELEQTIKGTDDWTSIEASTQAVIALCRRACLSVQD